MKMVWKNKSKSKRPRPFSSVALPFELPSPEHPANNNLSEGSMGPIKPSSSEVIQGSEETSQLARRLQDDGDNLAEEGKFGEALSKWEAAIVLTPKSAVLHEQKAQVLMEMGRSWLAVQAAGRVEEGEARLRCADFSLSAAAGATELQPSWPEAWVTLARAQLNYGEPDLAVASSRTALTLSPGCKDAQAAFETAQRLSIKQRHMSFVGVAAATRLAVGGVHSVNVGNIRRAVVVDGEDPTNNIRVGTSGSVDKDGTTDADTDTAAAILEDDFTPVSTCEDVVDGTGIEGAQKKSRMDESVFKNNETEDVGGSLTENSIAINLS